MILILSDSRDSSTTDVIKWLNKYNHDYLLINEFNQISDVFVYKKKNKKSIHLHTTLGAEIKYCRTCQCFKYTNNFKLKVTIETNEMTKILGGQQNNLQVFDFKHYKLFFDKKDEIF